jgi:3-oxoacyl-[acyl-carrier protein] reductase
MDHTGKAALVTGGGSGIGKATAELFVRRGGSVLVADINEAAAAATAEEIRRAGGQAEAVRCDVSLADQAQAAVDRARGRFGRLDILINCAGILRSHYL